MTGTRVSAATAYTAHQEEATQSATVRGHRVRELVCSYRPVRDQEGRVISVPSLAIDTPHAGGTSHCPADVGSTGGNVRRAVPPVKTDSSRRTSSREVPGPTRWCRYQTCSCLRA
jgi:hypothetical protein